MNIEKKTDGNVLTVVPDGRIDTLTAPELEASLTFDGVTEIVFDLSKVDYISSAGLRVLVRAKKRLPAGRIVIAHACQIVREVFDIVGYADEFAFV